MDVRRAFLRGATVDPRRLPSEAPPHPDLPGYVSAAAGRSGVPPGCDALRSGASQNASRLGLPSLRQTPPSAPPRPTTRPGDLVARALRSSPRRMKYGKRVGASIARRGVSGELPIVRIGQ